jgi:hypothetical protein
VKEFNAYPGYKGPVNNVQGAVDVTFYDKSVMLTYDLQNIDEECKEQGKMSMMFLFLKEDLLFQF